MARSKREKRRVENKEDIKNLLEEIWDFFPEESFYEIFTKAASKGIQDILNLPKDDLRALKWIGDNDDVSNLTPNEVSRILSLRYFDTYRKTKGHWPEGASDLRYNTISIDDWEDFIRDPSNTRMLQQLET